MIRSIIGTGGHIDHGKTALVEALTGVRTDRLPEEKRRGITIDLGFARMDLEDAAIGLVDVPGHEDFVRNMVAGASGFDLLLLVVAADEGVMPQTREHVAIAQLLGVPRAVVALTKTDLVEPEWLELARDDVAEFMAGTGFADARIVSTSAVTGAGLDELRAAIRTALPPNRGRADDLFRLPVDRVFTVRGTGTVITGTVWSGSLAREQHVRVLPGELTARVRGLQVHGDDVERIEPGQRAAIALAGVERAEAGRGSTLVTHRAWTPTRATTIRLRVIPGSRWSIKHGQRIRVHLGTGETMARAFLIGHERLEPGKGCWAQLRFEAPVVARAGDRAVIRSYSPVTTIGGGIIVEPSARRRRRLEPADAAFLGKLLEAPPLDRVAGLVTRAAVAGADRASLPIITGATPAQVDDAVTEHQMAVAGERCFCRDAVDLVDQALRDALDSYHHEHPLRSGMEVEQLRRAAPRGADPALIAHALALLLDHGEMVIAKGRIARTGFAPTLTADQEAIRQRILATFHQAGYAPPRSDQLQDELGSVDRLEELIAILETEGSLVRLEHQLLIHREHLEAIVRDVRARFAGRQDVSPAEFREVVPASRRHLIPILEHLDRTGVTVRAGEGRAVPGP